MKDNMKFVLTSCALFVCGVIAGSFLPTNQPKIKDKELISIIDAWNLTKEYYLLHVDKEKLKNGALEGMAKSLDPHSSWLPPKNAEEFSQVLKGEYGGVGMKFTVNDNDALITNIKSGGPAYKAGIVKGDIILEVNGKKVSKENLDKLELKGKPGTLMNLKIKKLNGDIKEYNIKRETIAGFEVESETKLVKNDNFLKIRIQDFQETTANEVAAEIRNNWKKKDYKALIIDLRSSPGGLVTSSAQLASLFLPPNKTVVNIKTRFDSEESTLKTIKYADEEWSNWARQVPIIIWADKGTASAAEILLSSLRENNRVDFFIGQQTFGKGTVQNVFDIDDGGYKMSMAWYTTPKNRYIQGNGEVPDVKLIYPKEIESKLKEYAEQNLPGYIQPPKKEKYSQLKNLGEYNVPKEAFNNLDSMDNYLWNLTYNINSKI